MEGFAAARQGEAKAALLRPRESHDISSRQGTDARPAETLTDRWWRGWVRYASTAREGGLR